MIALFLISMLMLCGSIFYLIYHFIRKIKDRDRVLHKKKFYSILIGSIIAFSVSIGLTDTSDFNNYNEVKKINDELTDNNLVLSAEIDDVKKDNDKQKKEIEQMIENHSEEITKLTDEHDEQLTSLVEKHEKETKKIEAANKTLAEDKSTLEKQNTDLEGKKTALENKVSELESDLTKAKAQIATASNSTNTKKESTKSNSNATTQNSNSNGSNSPSVATASDSTECNIKGSNSGIYHVPGSTYYNRTTNVAQWFCSTAEAEAAGYRAPKR